MRTFRALTSLLLIMTIIGSLPASARCVGMTYAGSTAASQARQTDASSGHAHHVPPAEGITKHGSSHPAPTPVCQSPACSTANPVEIAASLGSACCVVEAHAMIYSTAYSAPALSFDPPPPRQNLV